MMAEPTKGPFVSAKDAAAAAFAQVDRLKAENGELQAALEFYGNLAHWEDGHASDSGWEVASTLDRDNGDKARAALAAATQEE